MGLPGLETLVPIVYTRGVKTGRITLENMVEKCCSNPAQLMGLYPRKGVIAAGSDADLAVIDPEKTIVVDPAAMETNADWSPYEGWPLAGFAESTYSRGRKIVDGYRFVGERGWGRWLPREKAGSLKARS
jgi:dihydropyrimidinase